MKTDVKELVSKMTLAEKASMVSGNGAWHTDKIERLGIPSPMLTDGPHGIRKQVEKEFGVNEGVVTVCFPTAVGTASSFDRTLLGEIGETLGNECQAEKVSVLLGPAVNIKRSPLCGRNFEYFSEDPLVAGELAQSYINGVQSKNIGTSIKHFAVNNQERRRMTISAVVDERTLRELYFPAFEIAVKKAQPWTVMCSYNKINGTHSSENSYLLNQVLRKEWGFKGYVMSDWGACNDRVKGLPAGMDLEMPTSGRYNTDNLMQAVREGRMAEKALDVACERILEKVFAYENAADATAVFDREADHKKAHIVATQSMVLLKNNGVLPLHKKQKIAFIGEFAKEPRYQGGGSSHVKSYKVVGALEAVKGVADVRYAKGFSSINGKIDASDFEQAIHLAKNSEVVVIFAGLPEVMESEGYDRVHLDLPRCQNELIEQIAEVNRNVVVVLHNGSPVLMPWLDKVGAVLESYLGGEAVGEAQRDLLFGMANPCCKLAETFPLALSDTPSFHNFPGNQLTVEHREGIFVGYRYYDSAHKAVLFPFGHGLSYTTFEYSELKLSKQKLDENVQLTVSFKVKNTGKMDGAEIVQLYVAEKNPTVFRAQKELKGFDKIFLTVGEEKEVSIVLNARAFSYYNVDCRDWYCESGEYDILIGASSREIRLQATVTLKNSVELPCPYDKDLVAPYYQAQISNVSDEAFSSLLGFPVPEANSHGRQQITLSTSIEATQYTRWGGAVNWYLRQGSKRKDDSLEISEMASYNYLENPLRNVVGFANGVTNEMSDAIVSILNDENVLKCATTLIRGRVNALVKDIQSNL